jgi:hypothetical protein
MCSYSVSIISTVFVGWALFNHLNVPKSRDPDAMVLRKRGHDVVIPKIKSDFNRTIHGSFFVWLPLGFLTFALFLCESL